MFQDGSKGATKTPSLSPQHIQRGLEGDTQRLVVAPEKGNHRHNDNDESKSSQTSVPKCPLKSSNASK